MNCIGGQRTGMQELDGGGGSCQGGRFGEVHCGQMSGFCQGERRCRIKHFKHLIV